VGVEVYSERYGALSPWRKWDMKFMQDYNFKVSGNKTNTIQFSIDVLNIGNFLNSDWGVVQVPTSVQPIGVSVTLQQRFQHILLMERKQKRSITMLVCCQDGKRNLD
jgi:hypothetical protein